MGLDSKSLPENLRRCIPKEERQKDMALQTSEEIADKQAMENEREMHETFANWCRVNNLLFIHSRMDRKSTIREGWPDFTVIRAGRCVCIEFKHGASKPSDVQLDCIAELIDSNTPVLAVDSVIEAIHWTRRELGV